MLTCKIIMRLSGPDKEREKNQLEEFCKIDFGPKVSIIAFGRQDSKIGPAITLFNVDRKPLARRTFNNNKELITFVFGYVQAHNQFDEFKLEGGKV